MARAGSADQLVDIADDLYGVAPADFIATRGARAAELSGDKTLAARVKELRKPAPAAWVINLLVRERRDDLEDLLDLGVELRAAQEALDRGDITRLAKERRTRVTALAQEGGALAADAGHAVQPAVVTAVAATLDAGLADPEAADAIRTGRLLRPLETIGFEPVDLAEAVAVPEAGSRAAAKRAVSERPKPRAIDDSDAELARARSRADAVLTQAERAADEASDELTALEVRLRDARKALAAAEREAESLEQRRDAATAAYESAQAAAETARAKRRELG
jgi:hypothetical protein